ncbi:MAG: methyl-accepting chemotaxis protein [Candidatus Oceanisphaera merdipullorum]|nr:methyl-accepting chemotaxis protein [Candidatus Oceanisphaera merdipullorum]
MGIGLRSSLAFALIGLLMLLLGGISLMQLKKLNEQITIIATERVPSLNHISDISKSFLQVRLNTLALIHSTDPDIQRILTTRLESLEKQMAASDAAYEAMGLHAEDKRQFERLKSQQASYLQLNHEGRRLSAAGRVEEAATLSRIQMSAASDEVMNTLQQLTDELEQRIISANSQTDVIYGNAKLMVVGIIVLAVFGMLALALLLTRSIVRPLADGVRLAKVIAAGDLTQVPVVIGRDEPAQLMQALAEMSLSLQHTVKQIVDSSQQLASTSEELSLVSTDASRGLQLQNQELELAVTAVTQMTSAAEEVARNAAETSRESESADERTQFGRDRVGSTLSAIEVLATELNGSMNDINLLANQAEQITQVLDVIHAIADQTNLLALNAAIEAARAGESGRGFAVVADEVRALAQRTQESTTEIEQMIKAVQTSSQHAVTGMKSSNDLSHSTLLTAREAGDALGEIASAIALINDRNIAIAGAAEQQAQVAREVDVNLNNIQDLSAQSAAGSNQTSASSQELARLAGDLSGLVNRFVI